MGNHAIEYPTQLSVRFFERFEERIDGGQAGIVEEIAVHQARLEDEEKDAERDAGGCHLRFGITAARKVNPPTTAGRSKTD